MCARVFIQNIQKLWTTINQNYQLLEELKQDWLVSGENSVAGLYSETEGNTPSLLVYFKIYLQIFTMTNEHYQKSIKPQYYYGSSPYQSTQESRLWIIKKYLDRYVISDSYSMWWIF